MQYRTSRPNTLQTISNYNNNNNNNNSNINNNEPKNTNNTTMETCFGCRQPGHHIAQCPLKATNFTPTQSIASNKIATLGIGHTVPQNSGPPSRNAPNFGQGHVNHMNIEEV
jgi:hypothetical protein